MKTLGFIAIDQYGRSYQIGNNAPRKTLLKTFNRQHCKKMYQDTKDGKTKHVGYIIAGLWLTVYVIGQWKDAV
jgi:hypothetical protein